MSIDAIPPSNVGYLAGDTYDFSSARASPTYTVSNATDFTSTCTSLSPGDIVVLSDGTYSGGTWTISNCTGTALNPIIITCATAWGATIRNLGEQKFKLSNCSHVIIGGFDFDRSGSTYGDSGEGSWAISVYNSDNIRFTGCRINNFQTKKVILGIHVDSGTSTDIRVDHWLITGSSTATTTGSGIMRQHYDTGSGLYPTGVTFNYLSFLGTYYHEKLISLSPDSDSPSLDTTIEYCEFVDQTNPLAINEYSHIAVKSSNVTIRYCYFYNTSRLARGYAVNLRDADYCDVYGNYFYKQNGIRVQGQYHNIYNNIFDDPGRSATTVWKYAIGCALWGTRLTSPHLRDTGNNTIVNNTIVNLNLSNGTGFDWGYFNGGYTNDAGGNYSNGWPPHDDVIKNNIIQGVLGTLFTIEAATDLDNDYNNFYAQASATNGNGYGSANDVSGNPLLDTDFRPQAGSSVLGQALAYSPPVTVDFYSNTLSSPPDIGAVSYISSTPTVAVGASSGMSTNSGIGASKSSQPGSAAGVAVALSVASAGSGSAYVGSPPRNPALSRTSGKYKLNKDRFIKGKFKDLL